MTAAPLLELVRDPIVGPPSRARPDGRASVVHDWSRSWPARRRSPSSSPRPGFGKTRLLCEWAARDPRPFAWVTLQAAPRRSGDAAASGVAGRRQRDAPSSPAAASCWSSTTSQSCAVPAARDDDRGHRRPVAGRDLGRARLAGGAAGAARAAARGRPGDRDSHSDLAMTRGEAASLLRGAGLKLGRDEIDALVRNTEGWPAALSLAALSLADQPISGPVVARFGGGDRLVAEYLRDEVLAGLEPDERRFVEQTAILDVLTAPLCDALARALGLGRHARPAAALRLPAGGAGPHGRALPSPSPPRRVASRRPEPLRSRARGAAAPARQRLARQRRRLRARAPPCARRGRGRARRGPGLERRAALGRAGLERHRRALAEPVHRCPDRGATRAWPWRPRARSSTHGNGDRAEHWLAAAAASAEPEIAGGVAALRAALGRDGLELVAQDAEHATALLAPGESLPGAVRAAARRRRPPPRRRATWRASGSRRARGGPPSPPPGSTPCA